MQTFDGTSTNLHHIWDTNMPEKLIGGYALSDAKSWADTLTTEIKSGDYSSAAPSWIAGMSLKDVQGKSSMYKQQARSCRA